MGACASFGLGRGGHLAGSVGLPGVRGRLRRKPGRFCHPQRVAPSRITGDTHGRVLELTASRLPRRNLIRRWSVGFSEESQKDCLYFSNDKCCPLCKKQAELALFMRKCEISNKDLLFLLGPVWVQAELGPALGRRAGEARTMGRCWPVPYAPDGVRLGHLDRLLGCVEARLVFDALICERRPHLGRGENCRVCPRRQGACTSPPWGGPESHCSSRTCVGPPLALSSSASS